MNTSALLFLVVMISMVIGVVLPQFSKIFAPYLLIWLGALLFLNLIQLEVSDLVSAFARPKNIVLLSLIKLVVLPLVLYASTLVIYPSLGLSVLLLSGISTGLGAPFVANFIGSNFTLIVGLIIVTSLAVPFVLPHIVHLLVGSHFSIHLTQMIVLLAAALFTPFLAGWVTKRFSTRAAKYVSENSLYFSIVLIMLINMAVFSKISIYFFESPLFVIEMTLIDFLLFGLYGTVGYTLTLVVSREKKSITNDSKSNIKESKLTAATEGLIAMAYINNILVVVFAEQFFGIQSAVLPALYNIPYYIGIIILKKLYSVQAQPVKN
ncbi:MAG: arsenic resistance protein [Candidatus Nitrosopolaris sp.]